MEKKQIKHKFWNTQPILSPNEIVTKDSYIEPPKQQKSLIEQHILPEKFDWMNVDMTIDSDVSKVSTFINKYYINVDKNQKFIGSYTPEYLTWMYGKSNHIGVCVIVKQTAAIVGFIIGKVVKTQINKNIMDIVDVNYLCVHPKLRSKRLAPELIKELTRQFNLKGYNSGFFTTTEPLQTPFATPMKYTRAININNLIETNYMTFDPKINIKDIKKTLKLPEKPSDGFKKLDTSHINQAHTNFNKYSEKYNFYPIFTLEEFKHIFYNNKFVTTYVYEDKDGNVSDFISYYTTLAHNINDNKMIKKANLFYYTCLNETQYRLIREMLIVARNNGIDVFNATSIMENQYILKELGFEEGPLYNYYLYNWKIKQMKPFQINYLNFV
jgi:glycylpeptide N-tetradecanoyltransferase